jgi:hypothetical protein
LHDAIDGLSLPAGTKNSLDAKLDAGLRLFERGQPCAAANPLRAFVNEVDALRRSRRISAKEAGSLIAQANGIIASLQAAGACGR